VALEGVGTKMITRAEFAIGLGLALREHQSHGGLEAQVRGHLNESTGRFLFMLAAVW